MITDSFRQPNVPRFLGYSVSAIVGHEGPISSRRQAVLKVFECLANNSVVVIQAPPFSGKSSFAFLLAQEAISRNIGAFYVSMARHPSLDELFPIWTGQSLVSIQQRNLPTLVFIDDCQSLYGLEDRPDVQGLWSLITAHQTTKHHPVKFIFLSTLTKAASELSPHIFESRFGADLLRPPRADIDEMFDDYDQLCNAVQQPPLGEFLRSVLWSYCGGHFGILRLTLFYLYQVKLRAKTVADLADSKFVAYLLSEEFNVKLRGLRIPYNKNSLTAKHISLLLQAMAASLQPSDVDSIASCDELVSLGLFSCSFDVLQPNTYEYASPALLHIVRNDLLSTETRPQHPPENLLEFVLNALRLLKVCFSL